MVKWKGSPLIEIGDKTKYAILLSIFSHFGVGFLLVDFSVAVTL